MLRVILSPHWFLTPDIIIDFFSFLVLLAVSIISIKYYKVSKNKNFLYLGVAFLLVGIGELARIVLNLGLYYDIATVQKIGQVIITSHVIKSIDWVYYTGFFLYTFLSMLGFYLIYYTTKKNKRGIEHLVVGYLLLVIGCLGIIAIITNEASWTIAHYTYHLTIIIFLALIFYNYLMIYKKNKSSNTKILGSVFLILLISHIILLLSKLSQEIYVIANLFELASFVLLLYIIVRIYKYGKKKQN